MKTLTRLLLCTALLATAMAARAERAYNQAELDALLAPVALYPDAVLSNILVAAGYPDDVREAAAWSRGNPQLRGDEALRQVENLPWHPSVKALVAMPEVLARMDESPTWLRDLGEAYRVRGPSVMETVQSLRQRAQASGNLRSDSEQRVYYEGSNIVVAPLYPNVVYVRYYDPFVVYGAWWWPAFRPIIWRPFAPRVVVINRPVYVQRPVVVRPPVTRVQFRSEPEPRRYNGPPSPAIREQQRPRQDQHQGQGYQRVVETRRAPLVQPSSQGQGKFAEPRGQSQQAQHGGGHRRD